MSCRKGKVLSSQVWGKIKCNARLTGPQARFNPRIGSSAFTSHRKPRLAAQFCQPSNHGQLLIPPLRAVSSPSNTEIGSRLDRSDRYKKWNKDHVLSFIPPDGHFDLLRYEAVPPHVKPATSAQSKPHPLPLVFKPELKLEASGGESLWP